MSGLSPDYEKAFPSPDLLMRIRPEFSPPARALFREEARRHARRQGFRGIGAFAPGALRAVTTYSTTPKPRLACHLATSNNEYPQADIRRGCFARARTQDGCGTGAANRPKEKRSKAGSNLGQMWILQKGNKMQTISLENVIKEIHRCNRLAQLNCMPACSRYASYAWSGWFYF